MRAFLFQALALADVLHHRDSEVRRTLRGPRQRDGDMRPDERAILADKALLHRVLIYLAGEQALEVRVTRVEVGGVGDVLVGARRELHAVVTEEVAEPLVEAQPASLWADLGNAGPRAVQRRPE